MWGVELAISPLNKRRTNQQTTIPIVYIYLFVPLYLRRPREPTKPAFTARWFLGVFFLLFLFPFSFFLFLFSFPFFVFLKMRIFEIRDIFKIEWTFIKSMNFLKKLMKIFKFHNFFKREQLLRTWTKIYLRRAIFKYTLNIFLVYDEQFLTTLWTFLWYTLK